MADGIASQFGPVKSGNDGYIAGTGGTDADSDRQCLAAIDLCSFVKKMMKSALQIILCGMSGKPVRRDVATVFLAKQLQQ